MSFEAKETSRHSGQPVDLFLFRYGAQATSYFAYTSHDQAISHDETYLGDPITVTYEPVPIMRDSVKSSGTLDKATMQIRAPKDIALADIFRVYPPEQVVTVTIRQGHLSDPDDQYLVVWAGRLLGFEREGAESVMSAEPISTSLRRSGLRRHYQISCPHYLYGPDCRADREAATVAGTVTSISGYVVTLTAGWNAHDVAKYRQGEFRWTKDNGETAIRQVLSVAGDALRLSGPPTDLSAGSAVTVALGCNHQTSSVAVGTGDCVNLHNNGPNFGGCKWIPTQNPIKSSSSEFY